MTPAVGGVSAGGVLAAALVQIPAVWVVAALALVAVAVRSRWAIAELVLVVLATLVVATAWWRYRERDIG